MEAQIALQRLLRTRFEEARQQNAAISIRSFSRRVGVHFAALSAILGGKRNVSLKLAARIADRLGLDPQARSELLALFPKKRRPTLDPHAAPGTVTGKYLELSLAQFKIAAEWEHFAVLSLMQCQGYESAPEWFAERLKITRVRAEQVIERLITLELVTRKERGELVRVLENHRTPDDFADLSLKKSHEQTLDLARESLHRDAIHERDFTAVTVAINPSQLSTAKEMIRKFQDDLCDRLETGKRTEVYRLSVQLFPLSNLHPEAKS